ncbi:hypothetical protein HYW11_02460 [Candidatus Peregrinibacteria bacterium]|nr:hypothetical protein [Candidatus Peregrinibacteria bacterium]
MLFRTLKKTAGILLLIIGIAALVTPLTPGAWLIFVGLELLGLRLLVNNGLRKYWARVRTFLKTSASGLLRCRRQPSQAVEFSRGRDIPPQ